MGNIRMLRRGLRGVISRRALLNGSKYGYHVQGSLSILLKVVQLNMMLFSVQLAARQLGCRLQDSRSRFTPMVSEYGFSALRIAREQFGT